eukprot:627476-Rhodomonas_salina.1
MVPVTHLRLPEHDSTLAFHVSQRRCVCVLLVYSAMLLLSGQYRGVGIFLRLGQYRGVGRCLRAAA